MDSGLLFHSYLQVIGFSLTGGGDDIGAFLVGTEFPISWLGGIEGDFSEHQVTNLEAFGLEIPFPLLNQTILVGG